MAIYRSKYLQPTTIAAVKDNKKEMYSKSSITWLHTFKTVQHALNGTEVTICGSTVDGFDQEIDLYTSKKTDTEHGLGESVVIMLTKLLEHLCCEIYIDSFFNSPLLQLKSQQQIYLCGTTRTYRKHMPKNLKQDKDLKRGRSQMLSANGITCVKWMDNRSVV